MRNFRNVYLLFNVMQCSIAIWIIELWKVSVCTWVNILEEQRKCLEVANKKLITREDHSIWQLKDNFRISNHIPIPKAHNKTSLYFTIMLYARLEIDCLAKVKFLFKKLCIYMVSWYLLIADKVKGVPWNEKPVLPLLCCSFRRCMQGSEESVRFDGRIANKRSTINAETFSQKVLHIWPRETRHRKSQIFVKFHNQKLSKCPNSTGSIY